MADGSPPRERRHSSAPAMGEPACISYQRQKHHARLPLQSSRMRACTGVSVWVATEKTHGSVEGSRKGWGGGLGLSSCEGAASARLAIVTSITMAFMVAMR